MVRATELTLDRPYKKGQFKEYTQPFYLGRYVVRHMCPYCLNLNPFIGCPFDCPYCFARGIQESKHTKFSFSRTASLDVIKREFIGAVKGKYSNRVAACIQMGVPVKIGTMSDPLQNAELDYRTTLGILQLLNEYQHPAILNTKGTPLLVDDRRYFDLVKSMPIVVQTTLTVNDDLSKQIEKGAPSTGKRLRAIQKLALSGVPNIVRIAPAMPIFEDGIEELVRDAYSAGVNDIQMTPLSLTKYSANKMNTALGYDYLAKAKSMGYNFSNEGNNIEISARWTYDLQAEMKKLCDSLGMGFYPHPDLHGMLRDTVPWRSCCGVEKYLGPTNMSWTFKVRGFKIKRHTTFAEYIKGSGCPYTADFKKKWDKGQFRGIIPGLSFHPKDMTYSLFTPHINGVLYCDTEGERLPDNEVEWRECDIK